MLIRVREGSYDPTGSVDQDDVIEPKGRELWSATVDDLTAAAFHAAEIQVHPGTWYSFKDFTQLVGAADQNAEGGVFSAVSMPQSGVGKPWVATIEVAERKAALMVCGSIIQHVEQLDVMSKVWIRVE